MKRIVPVLFLLLFFATESFGREDKSFVGAFPEISYVREIQYTYTQKGEKEITVRALDINGINFIQITRDENPFQMPVTVMLGGDDVGFVQVPGEYLEILYLEDIPDTGKQQIIVKLPPETLPGTHSIFVNVQNYGGTFSFTIEERGMPVYACPSPCGSSSYTRGPTFHATCKKFVNEAEEIFNCKPMGNLISPMPNNWKQ